MQVREWWRRSGSGIHTCPDTQLFKSPPQLHHFLSFLFFFSFLIPPTAFPSGVSSSAFHQSTSTKKSSSCLPPNDFSIINLKTRCAQDDHIMFPQFRQPAHFRNAPAGVEHRVETPQPAFRPGVANREPVSGESVSQTRKRFERPVAPPRVCGCQ
ncbi:hypothetical protein B0H65DRAFT_42206 [Neurospora tetraspora]|uniref:Uncharacterized protein n=1 Tax=Neurospora tetraspora TaxID=94610 RepID=A0AAE0JQP9_9PEZI|nr:hypothetical protein B0H65DRAFT_42206 [Neurospora tetraspora]